MRHNNMGKRLSRNTNQRKALMKNLAVSLICNERLETTVPKAKELRSFIEPFITRSRTNTVANKRLVMARLGSKTATNKLFDSDFVARFINRAGGYIRIIKTSHRLGDAADMAIIEFVDYVMSNDKENS